MDHDTNEQLAVRAANGDEPAFAELVKRNLSLVYGICLRYLRHQADAEDITQDVFVKVWKNLQKFDAQKNFQAWAAQIARNACLDLLRKKKTIPFSAFAADSGDNFLADVFASSEPQPAELANRSIMSRVLAAGVKTLPARYQKVLLMYYMDGLNFREIAEQLKEPLHTIKSRHRRAIISLKKIIKEN
jgi:RNA polymerase sigma-70 factor (ECF subfamily)